MFARRCLVVLWHDCFSLWATMIAAERTTVASEMVARIMAARIAVASATTPWRPRLQGPFHVSNWIKSELDARRDKFFWGSGGALGQTVPARRKVCSPHGVRNVELAPTAQDR